MSFLSRLIKLNYALRLQKDDYYIDDFKIWGYDPNFKNYCLTMIWLCNKRKHKHK